MLNNGTLVTELKSFENNLQKFNTKSDKKYNDLLLIMSGSLKILELSECL